MNTTQTLQIPLLAFIILTLTAPVSAANSDSWDRFHDVLDEGKAHQTLWSRGWTAFFGASAAVSLYLGTNASDSEDRYDARVRTVTSALGLGDTLINPPPHADAYREFQYLRRYNYESEQGLDQAATLLEGLRREEQERGGWRGRIGAAIVNFGAYLAIAVGDGRTGDGAQVAGIGMLVNEVKLRTAPRSASNAPRLRVGNASVELHPQVFATTHGLGMRIGF